ncbi:MAG: HupE/UreJ family protein [Planctomycetes bacterium]|nr:HupE/UreJ family protein [Planctomycetota bacterium]
MRSRWMMVVAATAATALAHDPGLSSATIRRSGEAMTVQVALANADAALLLSKLDTDGDRALVPAELQLDGAATVTLCGGWTLAGLPAARVADLRLAENRDVEFMLTFAGAADGEFAVPALAYLSRSHRHYVVQLAEPGGVIAEALLSPAMPGLVLTAATAGTGSSFFLLGIEHILIGYDHICFLFGLLLLGGGWRRAAMTITAFTLAHSLTLAAASLGVLRLPSAMVESVIAASIVWVALENVLRRQPMARHWPAFGFGLVHGFGFASVLTDLRVGAGDIVAPLLAFNLGVEVGQLAIAALVLPLLAVAARRGHGRRVMTFGSLAVALPGLWWLCERLPGVFA